MKKSDGCNDTLQAICRGYLVRLRNVACRYGLGSWLEQTISASKRGECEATETEVEMLSRICDDDRLTRVEVPKILGMSYRKADMAEHFQNLRKLRRVGIYSKVSAMLYKQQLEENDKSDNGGAA